VKDSMEGQRGMSNTQAMANLSTQQMQRRNEERQRIAALKKKRAVYQQAQRTAANAEYQRGVDRSAAYKKKLEQGGVYQASNTRGFGKQPSTGSYKPAKAPTPSYNATAGNTHAKSEQSIPEAHIFCPPVGLQFSGADYNSTHPLSINMTCPALNQCVWENTGSARRGNGQVITNPKSWGDKQPANTNACKSLYSSCLDTFRKRTWGENYNYCKADMNQSHGSGISRGSSK